MNYQVIYKETNTPVLTFDTETEARNYIAKYLSWATHYISEAPQPCCVKDCEKRGYKRYSNSAPVGYWCSMHYKAKTYPYKN